MRHALAVLALALPLAAAAQPIHAVTDGVWTVGGTALPDTADLRCTGGFAQLNGTNPVGGPAACTAITRIDLALGDGDDFATLHDLGLFGLDPGDPGTLDTGGGMDILQLFFETFPGDLEVVVETIAGGANPVSVRVSSPSMPVYEAHVNFDAGLFLDLISGTEHDRFFVKMREAYELQIGAFTGDGDDEIDATGSTASVPLFVSAGLGNDRLTAGLLDTRFAWAPGDGTDRYIGGLGHNVVEVFGDTSLQGIHMIRGFLDPGCAVFDFNNGGGVIDEGIDEAAFHPGDGGIDLFVEFDCGIAEAGWDASAGTDRTFLSGRAGGGLRLDLDFESDTAVFADGFESGNVSRWSTNADATGRAAAAPWDGLEYQDWASFADPATSGPSTVTVRGIPDFPVTIDLGPDGGTGRGGAADTLRVDPLGETVTDDGSQIVVGGGPPITYRGADVVVIVDPAPPTAAEDAPSGAPTLTATPNPSAQGTRIRLEGSEPVDVRVLVLDALGRQVVALHDGPARPGHEWTLPAGRLAPGVYVVLAHGTDWVTARTVVVAE